MRLLLHQALTDLRHLRSLLLVYPFDALIPDLAGGPRRSPNEFAHLVLWVGSVALAVVIGVRLVQSDAPSRSTAFWLTRPIGVRSILVAKLATAALFLALLPTAADVAVLAANGFPADVLYAAGWQGLLEHLVLVGTVLALAAVSADAGGFALAGLAVFAGGLASLVVVGTFVGRGTPPGPGEQWSPLAEIVIVAASGVVVTSVQYLGRSRRLSAALVGAAVVLWALTLFSGPSSLPVESREGGAPSDGMRVRAVPGSSAVSNGVRIHVVESQCGDGACELVVREVQAIFQVPRGRRVEWPLWPRYQLITPASAVGLQPAGRNEVRVAGPLVPGNHLLVTWRRLRFRPVAAWADSRTLAESWLVPVLRERVGPATPEIGAIRGVER